MTIGPGFDDVLAAAQARAGWACTRLYESLAPAVAGYLRNQGVREPEDVTSEVFLAVFARLGSFAGTEAQFRSWVFTITHHRIVDDRRSAARRPAPQSLDALPPDGRENGWSEPAEDDAIGRLGTERVQRVLAGLTPDQRDVLTLRVLADLTVDQVAAVVGKPPGAVKALQRRALATLRKVLATEAVSL